MTTDNIPSIAELQQAYERDRFTDEATLIDAIPVLLEIAAAALAWLECPGKGLGSRAEHALADALSKVRS